MGVIESVTLENLDRKVEQAALEYYAGFGYQGVWSEDSYWSFIMALLSGISYSLGYQASTQTCWETFPENSKICLTISFVVSSIPDEQN